MYDWGLKHIPFLWLLRLPLTSSPQPSPSQSSSPLLPSLSLSPLSRLRRYPRYRLARHRYFRCYRRRSHRPLHRHRFISIAVSSRDSLQLLAHSSSYRWPLLPPLPLPMRTPSPLSLSSSSLSPPPSFQSFLPLSPSTVTNNIIAILSPFALQLPPLASSLFRHYVQVASLRLLAATQLEFVKPSTQSHSRWTQLP